MQDFFSEIEIFGQERVIYQISDSIGLERGQRPTKIRSMTKKQGHQKFSALKWKFFYKNGHSNIWSAKFFSVPQNSAPSLRQCQCPKLFR